MRITGSTMGIVEDIISGLDIEVSQTFRQVSKNVIQVSLRAHTSDSKYARRQFRTGHRSVSLCWHGFKDFITCVLLLGARRVQTVAGDWDSLDAFQDDLYRIANINVGSMMEPRFLGWDNQCECDEDIVT